MKLFQYDKKIWDWEDGDIYHDWQFFIANNKSLFSVCYETPGKIIHNSGGINILISFFGGSIFSISLQQRKFGLSFGFFAEYFEGWGDD